jgi:hypothetical protein
MKKDMHNFVENCDTYKRNKGEMVKPLGELQPSITPTIIWIEISMDFIVGLPKVGNKLAIIVVVDHLSKYAPFYALKHLFKASVVAQIFMENVFKIHGMPNSIVLDHDPTFTNNF